MNTEHKEQHDLQPESSGIKPKPIIWFLVILTVSTILVFLIVEGMLFGFKMMEEASQPQPITALPEGKERRLPPEPRLQGAPGPDGRPSRLPLIDMERERVQSNEEAQSYGWVNKDSGIARIPLDRAKTLIAERGLLMGSDRLIEEVQKAEAARKRAFVADPSAGRTIGRQ
jgi:hypothetical protein